MTRPAKLSQQFLVLMVMLLGMSERPGAQAAEVVTLPIKSHQGRVLLPAELEGAGPLSLMLDTGYTIATLHPAIIDRLGIQPSGSVRINGIAGEERAPTYRGLVFSFGGLKYSPSRVASLRSERDQRRRRDGIVGSGFFRQFVVDCDFRENVVRLHPPADFQYGGSGEIIPLQFKHEIPFIKASLIFSETRTVEAALELDTGCDSGLCLGNSFTAKNKLLETLTTEENRKFGTGGSVQTKSGTIPRLRLGTLDVPHVDADFFVVGSPVDQPMDGHLGIAVLRRFRVIFDYSRKQLILEGLER